MFTTKELQEKVFEDFEKADSKRNKYMIVSRSGDEYFIANTGSRFEPITNGLMILGDETIKIEAGKIITGKDFTLVVRPSKLISVALYENENNFCFRFKVDTEKTEKNEMSFLALFETKSKTFIIAFDFATQKICAFCVCSDDNEQNIHKALYNSVATHLQIKGGEDNE